jgi:general secretion pathway protein H
MNAAAHHERRRDVTFRPRLERGFTLLELVLVVMLIALMFTLVPRLFGSGVSGTELKSNVRALAAAMKLARDSAINTRREAFVTVNVESREFTTTFENKTHKLNEQLTMKLFTSQADQINEQTASFRFYPDGSSNGGRVSVAAGEVSGGAGNAREFAIDVDWLTGRVTVSDLQNPKL